MLACIILLAVKRGFILSLWESQKCSTFPFSIAKGDLLERWSRIQSTDSKRGGFIAAGLRSEWWIKGSPYFPSSVSAEIFILVPVTSTCPRFYLMRMRFGLWFQACVPDPKLQSIPVGGYIVPGACTVIAYSQHGHKCWAVIFIYYSGPQQIGESINYEFAF